MRVITAILILMIAASAGSAQHAPPVRLACLSPDSLRLRPAVFGDIRQSEVSGDYSGFELWFSLDSAGYLAVSYRDARGGLPAPRAVDSLSLVAGSDSLHIAYSSWGGGTWYKYRLHLACDRLTGHKLLFVTADNPLGVLRGDMLPRVHAPLPNDP